MGLREIINRITKIENGLGSDEMVTLIVLENGVEYKRYVPIVDAAFMVLEQNTGFKLEESRIIGVEEGDDDNFIGALLTSEPLDPKSWDEIVEV